MAPTGQTSPKSVNADRSRKRVEAETASVTQKRAKNVSDFTRCEGCNKSVSMELISMHDCGLDAKIKMDLETFCVELPIESVEMLEKRKNSKKERDPSKRPLTPFFLFLEDFRKTFKKANPDNKKVTLVGKEGGVKWNSMTEEEKKPYIEKAAEQQEKNLNYWRTQIELTMNKTRPWWR